MTARVMPATARIVDLRMRVTTSADETRRPLTRRAPYGPAFREMWTAQIALAALSRTESIELTTFFESLDGRVSPFMILLKAGKFSVTPTHTASLAAVPSTGADTVRLNLSPASGTLKRGTLFAIGRPATALYQMLEVIEDVAASADTTVKIAPRVRSNFGISDPVTLGEVYGKFTLAEDKLVAQASITSGIMALSLVEAL